MKRKSLYDIEENKGTLFWKSFIGDRKKSGVGTLYSNCCTTLSFKNISWEIKSYLVVTFKTLVSK